MQPTCWQQWRLTLEIFRFAVGLRLVLSGWLPPHLFIVYVWYLLGARYSSSIEGLPNKVEHPVFCCYYYFCCCYRCWCGIDFAGVPDKYSEGLLDSHAAAKVSLAVWCRPRCMGDAARWHSHWDTEECHGICAAAWWPHPLLSVDEVHHWQWSDDCRHITGIVVDHFVHCCYPVGHHLNTARLQCDIVHIIRVCQQFFYCRHFV